MYRSIVYRSIAVLAVSAWATSARASDRPLWASIIASNVADLVSSKIALGRPGTMEANPIMRGNRLYVVKSGMTTVEILLIHHQWTHGHKRAAVINTIILSTVNGAITVHNLRQGRLEP